MLGHRTEAGALRALLGLASLPLCWRSRSGLRLEGYPPLSGAPTRHAILHFVAPVHPGFATLRHGSPIAATDTLRPASLPCVSLTVQRDALGQPIGSSCALRRRLWPPACCDKPQFLRPVASGALDPQNACVLPLAVAPGAPDRPRSPTPVVLGAVAWTRWRLHPSNPLPSDCTYRGTGAAPRSPPRSTARPDRPSLRCSDQELLQTGRLQPRIYSTRAADSDCCVRRARACCDAPPSASGRSSPDPRRPSQRRRLSACIRPKCSIGYVCSWSVYSRYSQLIQGLTPALASRGLLGESK